MTRLFMLVGAVAGLAVLFPMLHERNPGMLDALVGVEGESAPTAFPQVAAVERPEVQRQNDLLTGRKVRLESDARGHFIGEFRLNGHRANAMVDTGATLVAINASMARRIGLNLARDDFRHSVETANGRARAALARIERMELGRIHVENVEAVVLDDEALGGILIGMSFLNQLRRFAVESGTLILEQ